VRRTWTHALERLIFAPHEMYAFTLTPCSLLTEDRQREPGSTAQTRDLPGVPRGAHRPPPLACRRVRGVPGGCAGAERVQGPELQDGEGDGGGCAAGHSRSDERHQAARPCRTSFKFVARAVLMLAAQIEEEMRVLRGSTTTNVVQPKCSLDLSSNINVDSALSKSKSCDAASLPREMPLRKHMQPAAEPPCIFITSSSTLYYSLPLVQAENSAPPELYEPSRVHAFPSLSRPPGTRVEHCLKHNTNTSTQEPELFGRALIKCPL